MAKQDERPVDSGVASLAGKDEPTQVEWWKARFGLLAAIPQEVARIGAMTPTIRQVTLIENDEERRKITRARIVAFAQLPMDQRQTIVNARKGAQAIDPDVVQKDQALVDELLPTLDASVKSAYPGSPTA